MNCIAGGTHVFPLLLGALGPHHGSLGPLESTHTKQHFDQFSCFSSSTVRGHVQQTTHTVTGHRTSVAIGRIFTLHASDAA